jgi:hypothetical protein
MEIQQWIGLIGVVAYWIFRAYTASKKASKNTPPPVKRTAKSRPEPSVERSQPREPMPPYKPEEEPVFSWETPESPWKYEEEPLQANVFSYEDDMDIERPKPKTTPQLQAIEEEVPKLKFKGFKGRDAVIYQAIMNRPQY